MTSHGATRARGSATRLPALGINFELSELGEEAYNITCEIKFPKEDHLLYKIVNDTLNPEISEDELSRTYKFEWKEYFYKYRESIFSQRNNSPALYAAIPRFSGDNNKIAGINTWDDFGKWYLSLCESKIVNDATIDSVALNITANCISDKAKIDAIFNFCQKNIRYEQVYLENCEFIPNQAITILKQKYVDCKVYSTLMIALARSAGLNAHYVLCYRGRGYRFYEDIPVSQFNHVIVHFNFEGKDYWYDGTNRIGLPGLTTIDLLGQNALIIYEVHTRLVSIVESSENLLLIDLS